jgi:hypothetical protein
MVAGRPGRDAEASSLRAGLPASGGPAASPEREQEHVDTPPPHFAEAQAEQDLWEELRDHDASLNRALMRRCGSMAAQHGASSRYVVARRIL